MVLVKQDWNNSASWQALEWSQTRRYQGAGALTRGALRDFHITLGLP